MELVELPGRPAARIRAIAARLPEAGVDDTPGGLRVHVRRRFVAQAFAIVARPGAPVQAMLVARADPVEREVLAHLGHPWFVPRSGRDRIGLLLDGTVGWDEVAELVTESYRLQAPKSLAALLAEPPAGR